MQDISRDVIERASEGDIEAFEEIYRISASYVYTIAYRVTHSKEDAEEVTQDVFMGVYRNIGKFQSRSTFKTWVYRITMNIAINLINRRKRKTGRTITYDDAISAGENISAGEEMLYKEDDKKVIESMLRVLPPEQKACIVLKVMEGLKYKEIAEILKININTVRSRLKRARERLLTLRKREASGDEV